LTISNPKQPTGIELNEPNLAIKECDGGSQIAIQALPRSSRNEVVGFQDGRLKIKLTSPPVDGSANRMCVKFLAKLFDVKSSSISIVSGETSRKKIVQIENLNPPQILSRLAPYLD
jgi:uncharacterized protein